MTLVKGVANSDDDFTILCTSYHIQRYDRDQTKSRGLLYNWAIFFIKSFLLICNSKLGLEIHIKVFLLPYLVIAVQMQINQNFGTICLHCEENCFKIVAVSRFQNYFATIQKGYTSFVLNFRMFVLDFRQFQKKNFKRGNGQKGRWGYLGAISSILKQL